MNPVRKRDVQIGNVYFAKVSGRVVAIRVESESRYGGWNARSLATDKLVRIKTAARLRLTR